MAEERNDMSDRLPGSGPTNPIVYNGWDLMIDDPTDGHDHAFVAIRREPSPFPLAWRLRCPTLHASSIHALKERCDRWEEDVAKAMEPGRVMPFPTPIINEASISACGNCRFYRIAGAGTGTHGWCRRFPPSLRLEEGDTGWGFPEVTENDWCGEWSQK